MSAVSISHVDESSSLSVHRDLSKRLHGSSLLHIIWPSVISIVQNVIYTPSYLL